MNSNSRLINTILSVGLVILLFIGGIGKELYLVRLGGMLVGLVMLWLALIKGNRIILPKDWWLYALFLLVIYWAQDWSRRRFASMDYIYLFLSGGVLWMASFNWQKELRQVLAKISLWVGAVFGSLFVYTYYFTDPTANSFSLYRPFTDVFAYHNNIADLWGVVGLVGLFILIQNHKKLSGWIWLGITGYMLYMGQSRSSLLSFGLAGWWLIDRMRILEKKWKMILMVGAIGLTMVIGQNKTILYSRQYYIQAVAGLLDHPQGIGLGSFRDISSDHQYHLWGMSDFASVTFNLILEISSGIGWLAIVYVIWFIRVGKRAMSVKGKDVLLYQAMWLSMTIDLMFHATYRVPAMYWLWMILLGVVG